MARKAPAMLSVFPRGASIGPTLQVSQRSTVGFRGAVPDSRRSRVGLSRPGIRLGLADSPQPASGP